MISDKKKYMNKYILDTRKIKLSCFCIINNEFKNWDTSDPECSFYFFFLIYWVNIIILYSFISEKNK